MRPIDKIKMYNEKTSIGSFIMPTIDTFDKKMLLAIKLWPQIGKDGQVHYLLGKGVGVEIAIRGDVQGRKKRNNNFSYRGHSDFEIYNCVGYDSLPESKAFNYVFGAQECYPKTETKGLKNMDPNLMDSTYETVVYKGNKYLVPELEILFLDKFLKKEKTPRKEGYDAILLLKEYELDMNKVLYYYDQYYYKVEAQKFIDPDKVYEQSLKALTKRIPDAAKDLLEEDGEEINLENITKKVNRMRKSQKNNNPGVYWTEIPLACCPAKIEYIVNANGELEISKETKKELRRLINEYRENQENEVLNLRDEIISIFKLVEKEYKPSTNPR